ncbi:hypothetical protein V8E36_000901 [Tilletia maclaganii]
MSTTTTHTHSYTMAKSLRSKSKVAARRIKRTDPASIYKITAEQRIQASAARLAALSKAPKVPRISSSSSSSTTTAGAEDGEAGVTGSEDMEQDQDGATKPKISTSGTRGSRRETWRAQRGWKARVGSKNNGKTKRRR